MRRPHRRLRTTPLFLLSLLVFTFIGSSSSAAADRVVVTILQTTDLHGHLLPWDYLRAQPADDGLARVATRVEAIRRESPNVLLLDAGDTIQGTPIEFLHAKDPSKGPDPMAEAMSAMRYDAMSVGNHEFNFGLAVLRKAQKESSFPWLSSNTRNVADGSAAFPEYVVRTVGGIRIGILGLTTPNIPNWEPARNRPGLRWEDPVDAAKRLVPVLRGKEKCSFVVALIHSGPEVDLKTGEPDGTEDENRVAALSKVPGIDLLLTGHTHRRIPLTRLNGVALIQPGRWGDVLARVDVVFEKSGKSVKVADLTAALLPSDASVATDATVAAIAAPHDAAARAYMDTVVATAEEDFPGARARLEDTALLDFVNDTMREATGADLSMTSLLPFRFEGFRKGPIKVRNVYTLYPYENQLVEIEVDGATLKACLEHAAEFYGAAQWEDGKLVLKPKENMIPYNFDVVQGAAYRIDPTAPVGSRVKDLAYKGRPVQPSDRFTLAVNAYRAQGSGGYKALKGAKVVKEFPEEIRELLIERLKKLGTVRPQTDRNWVVAPDAAWGPEPPRRPAP
ncbi:MAG TPA: bifunctional UDP-sugar hydrolase/5'-nucleotidase [Thermoanaerobaculia bacterium]|nr:bifunctional UDP-sugar hydrolase/5'-nucleotidase [Thermoanaerobaculia bacterium]